MLILIILLLLLKPRFFNFSSNDYLLALLLLLCISNTSVYYSNYNIKTNRSYPNRNNFINNVYYDTPAKSYINFDNFYYKQKNYNANKRSNPYINLDYTYNQEFTSNIQSNSLEHSCNSTASKAMHSSLKPNRKLSTASYNNTSIEPIFNSYDECIISEDSYDEKIEKNILKPENIKNTNVNTTNTIPNNNSIYKKSISENSVLNKVCKGDTITITLDTFGTLTGTVLSNYDEVISLKLLDNRTIYINKKFVSCFY